MDKTAIFDIAFCGNYAKDTIITPEGSRGADGGGLNYGAHAAAGLGLNVIALTRLAKEDEHVVDNLRAIGVTVKPTFTPTSTHMILDYPTPNPDDRTLTCHLTAGAYTLDQFDDVRAKALIISASIREEIPLPVFEGLRSRFDIVVADAQGFLRIRGAGNILANADWPDMEVVLPQVDVFKTDAVEAEFLTGDRDIRTAAQALAALGPQEIVLTHRDGILVLADGSFYEAEFHPVKLVGRSGRGDTCIASYMAKRLSAPPAEAIIWSAAVTSLKMEADSPFLRTVADVEELIDRKYRL